MKSVPVSDAIRQPFSSDDILLPRAWLTSPLLCYRNGKTNLIAIMLLADLVAAYCHGEKLQRDYQSWGNEFGFTKRQTQDACHFLRNTGLITIEARTVQVQGLQIGNVLFLEPVGEVLNQIRLPVLKHLHPRPSKTPKKETPGFVYLFHGSISGLHKIGYTTQHVEIRRNAIIKGSGEHVTIIHIIKCENPRALEKHWHEQLSHKRRTGEWFELDEKDLALFCAQVSP